VRYFLKSWEGPRRSDKKTDNVLSQLRNQPCQGNFVVVGRTLILYLGDVLQEMAQDTPLKTVWYLWIECAWRLYERNKIICGCYDDPEFVVENVLKLEKTTLDKIKHDGISHDLELKFSNNMKLELFCDSTTGDQWQLMGANGYRYGIEANLTPREWMVEPDE